MTMYTGVADANGDFIVPFSSSYTSGQKVTVTAEKDGATKSIEFNAPSQLPGLTFSGSMQDFPKNIEEVNIIMSGRLQDYAFSCIGTGTAYDGMIARAATKINIIGCSEIGRNAFEFSNVLIQDILAISNLQIIGDYAFKLVIKSQEVVVPAGKTWGNYVFNGAKITKATIANGLSVIPAGMFYQCAFLISASLPASTTNIGSLVFSGCTSLIELIVLSITPPTLASNALTNINSSCVIKVPMASLSAYQAANGWSAHASKLVGV